MGFSKYFYSLNSTTVLSFNQWMNEMLINLVLCSTQPWIYSLFQNTKSPKIYRKHKYCLFFLCRYSILYYIIQYHDTLACSDRFFSTIFWYYFSTKIATRFPKLEKKISSIKKKVICLLWLLLHNNYKNIISFASRW